MSSKDFKNNILNRPGHPDGMTVPPGYFEAFAADMASKLPPNTLEQQPVRMLEPPTLWRRVRPFVYMAAMFAGIWCMMKMFSMVQNHAGDINFDRSPALTAALSNDDFVYDYLGDGLDEGDILNDLYADGFNAADLTL